MGSILRVLTGVAIVLAGALVAAWSAVTTAVLPLATVTGLVMGGTGWPLMNVGPIPTSDSDTAFYLGWTADKYIEPSLATGVGYEGSVAVYTPEEFWPLPNQKLTFNESVTTGLTNLSLCVARSADCVHNPTVGLQDIGTGPLLVFGYSQSARIATNLKQGLVNTYNAVGWDNAPNLDFVLIGNPNRPNGGLLQRFVGLQIPFFGISFDGATPTNSGCDAAGTNCHFNTTDFSAQYDGYSDFPKYPLNVLADLNALAGIFTVHGSYFAFDTTNGPMINEGRYGDT